MPDAITLRPAGRDDRDAVASLIHASTNAWYRAHLGREVFAGPAPDCAVFFDEYEALDPGHCLLAVDHATGRLAGSCFHRFRPTHVALGIVNTAPAYAGRGVARRLVQHVLDHADERGLPTRLVSSAMSLDSYSLYTRLGFRPVAVYQDIILPVAEDGFGPTPPGRSAVREATRDDLPAIAELELACAGVTRGHDYAHFLDSNSGIWRVRVLDGDDGLRGVLASSTHPTANILGPGVMRDDDAALALLAAELDAQRGRSPLILAPADRPGLIASLYAWGGRNCELHVAQARGESPSPTGVVLPTFLPETG